MKIIYFITSNKGKALEAKIKLSKLNIEVIQKNLGYPEIQADTLEDVAIFGVENIKKKFGYPFILEDAGLFIDALDGFPGVYSAYVFYRIGCTGILKLMDDKSDKNRKATFRSIYAYSEPKKEPILFLGECQGTISSRIVGNHGFGYDPIFIPDGKIKTFGQMEIEEKNCLSHRSKSLDKFIEFFTKL
jgi:XTP/dITP diphosphohydrolase